MKNRKWNNSFFKGAFRNIIILCFKKNDIIKEKFLQFENILKDFEKIWHDLIDVFFDEKEFWDYFFIDSKDLILVLELLENKKAKPNLVLKFENKKGSLFYFKIKLKK